MLPREVIGDFELDHYSLKWIHGVQEKNYEETKDEPSAEVLKKSIKRAKRIMKEI